MVEHGGTRLLGLPVRELLGVAWVLGVREPFFASLLWA